MPAFERIDGVASVDATGLVEQQVTVTLDQVKIDALNDKVLAGVDSGLADAQRELREGQAKVADGKAKLAEGEAALESQKGSALDKLAQGSAQVDGASATLSALLSEETTLTARRGVRGRDVLPGRPGRGRHQPRLWRGRGTPLVRLLRLLRSRECWTA